MASTVLLPRLYVPILISGMLVSGSANSIFSKWQDMTCVENCEDPNPARRVLFEQPVFQTLQMFIGEMLCFLPVLYALARERYSPASVKLVTDEELDRSVLEETSLLDGKPLTPQPKEMRGISILLMWIPAFCDLTGTTLMMVGLLYTPVSIYQMTRGALVLWVGLFSVMFLRRRLWPYQWLSLVTVMLGVSLVGLSGSLAKDTGSGDGSSLTSRLVRALSEEPGDLPTEVTVFIGVLFILFAQLFTATQFVVEEKIMSVFSVPPLLAVGYEGFFGALSIGLLLPLTTSDYIRSVTPFFDLKRGWNQMMGSPQVLYSSIAIALSIAIFNACGLGVTRHVNATARSTADTCRTIGIWAVSLALGWEKLTWPWTPMQLAGFALLVYGTFVFNDITEPPKFLKPTHIDLDDRTEFASAAEGPDERRALLAERSLEETATLPANLGGSGYDVMPPSQTVGGATASCG